MMSKKARVIEQDNVSPILNLEYYQRAFALMGNELSKQGYDPTLPHPLRQQYWGLLIPREYAPFEAHGFVHQYFNRIEEEIASILREHSIAYWLHIYRRLSPGAIGRQKDAETIYITRLILEAAIQKYGQIALCSGLAMSNEVSIGRVLQGILLSEDLELERKMLQESAPQLVLTDFGVQELREFYDLERLAFELWRCGAMLRIVSKGASINVDESIERVYDLRNDELDRLVNYYDNRGGEFNLLSSKGVVNSTQESGHNVFLLSYNVYHVPYETVQEFYAQVYKLRLTFPSASYPNFLWLPFPLQSFLERHQPFADAFRLKYEVSLQAVLSVIAAINFARFDWISDEPVQMVRLAQRGYRGPTNYEPMLNALLSYKQDSIDALNISQTISDDEFIKAIDFWTLNEQLQSKISLAFPGPQYIFLPYENETLFVDHAWISRRLIYLFLELNISNENFKGDFLESLVRLPNPPLPSKPCKGFDGTSKEIDASFQLGERLIIVECKAQGMSAATFKGDPMAVPHRLRNLEKALTQVDDTAKWLAEHPKGTNYDITQFREILPIVVTPFNEYVPSLQQRYWVNSDLARVLVPSELHHALDDGTLAGDAYNLVYCNLPLL